MPLPFTEQYGRNREFTITSSDARTANTEDDVTLLEMSSDPDDDYLLRIATSASRYSLGTTAGKEGVRLNFSSPATSGTARGLDVRLTQSGAGGESDCLRVFETVSANTTTCRGAHISLNFLATAGGSECSGLGTPVAFTLHLPDVASWAPTGTLAAGVFEIYSDGEASDPAGLTELSVLRLCNSGDATGAADVDTDAYLFSLQGWTGGSGKMFESSRSLKCLIGSTPYYLPVLPAVTDGVVFGVGSASAYHNFGSTADKNAMEFRFTTAATTGTSRGMYLRLNLTGAAGGESLRAFTSCASNTPADTVNGAHISLTFGASAGNVTGLGTAGRFTVHVPDRALTGSGGAVMGEFYADADQATFNGQWGLFRGVLGGDPTGLALLDDTAYFMILDGGTTDTGNICHTNTAADATHGLRCLINGVSYDILLKAN